MKVMPTMPFNFNQKVNNQNNQPAFGKTIKDCCGYLKPNQEVEFFRNLESDVEHGIFPKLLSKSPISIIVANPEETRKLVIVGRGTNYEQVLYSNFESTADEFGTWTTTPDMFDSPEVKKYVIKMFDFLNINLAPKEEKDGARILPFRQLSI